MIAKGTTHNNGARLAEYLIHSKEGEKAELFELRGFAEEDVVDAFRSVHVMADAMRCENPFYHCQIRTPDGETLTREQWLEVAYRIEERLGLTDQPRAIAFHDKEGHEHMHVAWSRIDEETMTAKELNFDHLKLKELCREIERDMGLIQVRNSRGLDEPSAPDRNELEEARRLGIDVEAIRQTIRDCWSQSPDSAAFMAALKEHELMLARGDRRDYVVVDQEGGLHALGKRLLGSPAAEVRECLSDLAKDGLPTVEFAREAQEAQRELVQDVQEIAPEAMERNDSESESVDQAAQQDDVLDIIRPSRTTTAGGMVQHQTEANWRHLRLNPFLKTRLKRQRQWPHRVRYWRSLQEWQERQGVEQGAERKPVQREAKEDVSRNVSDGSQSRQESDLADQILEQWRKARDEGRER
jgi:hypothetical protein